MKLEKFLPRYISNVKYLSRIQGHIKISEETRAVIPQEPLGKQKILLVTTGALNPAHKTHIRMAGHAVDSLTKSPLFNQQNEIILSLSSKKIKEINLKIINELYLPKKMALEYMKKLDGYRYVDEINDLKNGSYIRWINITEHSNLKYFINYYKEWQSKNMIFSTR